MTNPSATNADLQRLLDKEAITDCLHRYCRGIDRMDRALMLSAYHADAFDDHGVSEGDPETFVDWARGFHLGAQRVHQHAISNIVIELDGDKAHVESYYCFRGDNKEGPPTLAFGRYVDQFDKRDGVWKIAYRVCINEMSGFFTPNPRSVSYTAEAPARVRATRDTADPSYERPLAARKEALA